MKKILLLLLGCFVMFGFIGCGDLAGGDGNLQNDLGRTALMIASYKGNIEMVDYLLEAGADVNIVKEASDETDYADTALDLAAENGHIEIIELLLSYNIEDLTNALFLAIDYNHIEIVVILIEAGVDFNLPSKKRLLGSFYTPIEWAFFWGNEEIEQLLLDYGAVK